MSDFSPRARAGFGKWEVLVVIVSLGLLACLALPWLAQTRSDSQRTYCESRQITVARAMQQYDDDHQQLPGYQNVLSALNSDPQPTGWVDPLLPYLGQDREMEAVVVCPEDPPPNKASQPGWLSFVVNSGMPDAKATGVIPPDWRSNGAFLSSFPLPPPEDNRSSLKFIEAHDGAQHTIMLSENVDAGKWTDSKESAIAFVWMATENGKAPSEQELLPINRQRGKGDGSMRFARPASNHVGGVNVAFCDGSTRFVSEKIDYTVFVRMMTPDDTRLKQAGTTKPIGPPLGRAGDGDGDD